jgi:putative transposase
VPEYRRARIPGSTVFLTIVTYQRQKLFLDPYNVELLRKACKQMMVERPLKIEAAVILPEHIHFMWRLPPDDVDYSYRVGRMKALFTRSLRCKKIARSTNISASRRKHRESNVWQRRFYEHTIRDEADWSQHFDYLHFNPVKHGLVKCVHQWQYSSFHREVNKGRYQSNWCCACGDNKFEFVESMGWENLEL